MYIIHLRWLDGLFKQMENTIQQIAWFVFQRLTSNHWIVIHLVDSVIQPLNNWGLMPDAKWNDKT